MTAHELQEQVTRALARLRAVEALARSWPGEASDAYLEKRDESGERYACGFEDGWDHATDLLRRTLGAP